MPRLFAIPPTVRRNCEALKWSAASTIASSDSESRRRIGSLATGASAGTRAPSSDASEKRVVRRRSGGIVGVVGEPSLTQPYSAAASWQSGHTSTYLPPPFGEKLTVRSPIRSVRSHTAHCLSVLTFVTLTRARVAVRRRSQERNPCKQEWPTPGPLPCPSSRSRSASGRCASGPPRSGGTPCGSRPGRRSSRSATASTSAPRPSAPRP